MPQKGQSHRAGQISVVVPHFQDLERLGRCLDALQAQSLRPLEIIVADNASPAGRDAVAAVIDGRARLEIVDEKGAGPARNGGAAVARGDILAFTDADCLPEPDWLARGVEALGDFDVVGGAVRVLVADAADMSGPEAFETVFAFDNEGYVRRKGFTVTANLFCSRAVFEAVGGFRVGVSEDLDWSHRATAKGYRLGYAGAAAVGHPARRTWEELTGKWRRLAAETFELYLARPHGRLIWLVRSLALPLSAVAHTPRVLASPRLPDMQARLAALRTLYRLRFWRLGEAVRLLART